eukprot:719971-Pelagomonas_calceolata.AAC.2
MHAATPYTVHGVDIKNRFLCCVMSSGVWNRHKKFKDDHNREHLCDVSPWVESRAFLLGTLKHLWQFRSVLNGDCVLPFKSCQKKEDLQCSSTAVEAVVSTC